MQHPTPKIKDLLDKLAEGYDVVYGKPERGQHGLFRNIASLMTKWVLQGAMDGETARSISAFRAFSRRLAPGLCRFPRPAGQYRCPADLGNVQLYRRLDAAFTPRHRDIQLYFWPGWSRMPLTWSPGSACCPLRFASALGLIMTAFGFLILIYIILSQVLAFPI